MTERHDHQCHRDQCDAEAIYAVDVHLNCCAPGVNHRVSMHSTIQVCEAHKDDVRGFILSDKNRETIRDSLMDSGLPEPDFLTAKIELVPIPAVKLIDVVIPVLPCDRDGCANPAKWRIKQRFRARWQGGVGEPRVETLTNLYVCDKHKKETKPKDLLDEESRAETLRHLNDQGMLLPDIDGMILEFVPVDGQPLKFANGGFK
jgi:hypothetical protein